jgi:hypothetical protein
MLFYQQGNYTYIGRAKQEGSSWGDGDVGISNALAVDIIE